MYKETQYTVKIGTDSRKKLSDEELRLLVRAQLGGLPEVESVAVWEQEDDERR